jgi:hypothetical protein
MSKYDPLSARLAAETRPEWRVSFDELEKVLGFALPKTARTGKAWWQNGAAAPQALSWAAYGWEVADVDQAAGKVTFRKVAGNAPDEAESADAPASAEEPAILTRLEATPKWNLALVTGGLVLAAGLSVFAIRGALRKK